MSYLGYTEEELVKVIREHKLMEPLKGTLPWQIMLLEAKDENLTKRIASAQQEKEQVQAELKKLKGIT